MGALATRHPIQGRWITHQRTPSMAFNHSGGLQATVLARSLHRLCDPCQLARHGRVEIKSAQAGVDSLHPLHPVDKRNIGEAYHCVLPGRKGTRRATPRSDQTADPYVGQDQASHHSDARAILGDRKEEDWLSLRRGQRFNRKQPQSPLPRETGGTEPLHELRSRRETARMILYGHI